MSTIGEPKLLDTIVELAALGTSGICICAIVASGVALWKTTPDAGAERYKTLRFYMVICLLTAIVSGTSGTLNAKYSAGKVASAEKIAQSAVSETKIVTATKDDLESQVVALEDVVSATLREASIPPLELETKIGRDLESKLDRPRYERAIREMNAVIEKTKQ